MSILKNKPTPNKRESVSTMPQMDSFKNSTSVKFGLNFKITLLFSLLLIFVICGISFSIFYTSYQKIEKYIISNLSALADSRSEYIKTLIREDFEDVNIFAMDLRVREYINKFAISGKFAGEKRAELDSILLNERDAIDTIKEIDIFDKNGSIIASTRPVSTAINALPARILSSCNASYLSDLYWNNKVLRYDISVPVCDGDRNVIGAVRASIDTSRLSDIITNNRGLGRTGEIILGRRKGDMIILLAHINSQFDPGANLIIPMSSKVAEPLRRAVLRKNGFMIGLDYRGREVIAAYRSLPVNNWGLVVKIDKEEAFSIVYQLLNRIIIIGFIALFVGIAITTIFARAIVKPIRQLESGMGIIASGDLDYHVDINSTDEIGALAYHFNNMTKCLKIITVSRDVLNKEVERRKLVEIKLREAIEAKSKFTSMISHELRTPLTAISEGIKIVRDGVVGRVNDDQKDCLERAGNNVERLSRLIKEILEYQKLDAGKMVFNIKNYDINKIVQDVYDVMKPQVRHKGIDFIFQPVHGLPYVSVDKDKIEQVLSNLISNGIKFTKKGSISIFITRKDSFAHISVSDTGCGIRKEDMPRLFQYFEQVGASADRKEGSGLGLAISHEIIVNHHGKIWAESEYGRGTVIHFTLPLIN